MFDKTEYIQLKGEDGKVQTTKVSKLTKVLYDKKISITPIDTTEEGVKSYIRALHDILYGQKLEKISEKPDPLKSFIETKKQSRFVKEPGEEIDDNFFDNIKLIDIHKT